MSDCGIGALDGVNEHGLAVAIAFGGRRVVGDGFGIGIVVRYVLEFAPDVPTALEMLARIPVHLAYNVALQDSAGRSAIAYLSPDRAMVVSGGATAANRQGATEWPEHSEFCATEDREAALVAAVTDPAMTAAHARQAVPRATALPTHGAEHAGGPSTPRSTTPTGAASTSAGPTTPGRCRWTTSSRAAGSARCPWLSRRPSSRTPPPPVAQGRPAAHRLTGPRALTRAPRRAVECRGVGCRPLRAVLR